MRILRRSLVVIGVAVVAAGSAGALSVDAAGAAVRRAAGGPGGWGNAVELSGTSVGALSCLSAGNCGGGGSRVVAGGGEAVVVSQVRGKWGRVLAVRGLAAGKGKPNDGTVTAIACTSAGNCVGVGTYVNQPSQQQAFIVTERRGAWGSAVAVAGLAALDTGKVAGLNQVTCASAGNCTAVGTYTVKPGDSPLFTVSEVRGVWGSAAPVPAVNGLPGQVTGEPAGVGLLSCPAPGDCSAAGSYQVQDNSGNQLFVMSEVNGTWGSATEIPGTAALNTGLLTAVNAINCSSPGNCSAGGLYWTSNQFEFAFIVNQVNGTWQRAIVAPGTSRFDGDWISAISCPSDGNCGAGGVENYENTERPFGSTFVINEVRGVWHRALPIPGTNKLNVGDDAALTSISCTTAWKCGAGGFYTPGNAEAFPYWDAFVVSETGGKWGQAVIVPGTKTENTRVNASITAISCGGLSLWCTAAGYLVNNKTGTHDFVVSKP